MKTTVLAAAFAALGAASALAIDASGTWQTEPNGEGSLLHVAIAPCGDALCGTILHAFGGDKKLISDYEHKGRQMIRGMATNGDGRWSSGTIWAPDTDKTYRAKMELMSADQLKVSGCVAGGLICRGQTWLRVK